MKDDLISLISYCYSTTVILHCTKGHKLGTFSPIVLRGQRKVDRGRELAVLKHAEDKSIPFFRYLLLLLLPPLRNPSTFSGKTFLVCKDQLEHQLHLQPPFTLPATFLLMALRAACSHLGMHLIPYKLTDLCSFHLNQCGTLRPSGGEDTLGFIPPQGAKL